MLHPIINEDIAKIASANLPWQQLFGKTILITGANGFLPAYMVHTLLHLNDLKTGDPIQVLALIRNRQNAEARFKNYLHRKDFRFIESDISKPLFIQERVHYIVHAASQASPKYYSTDPVGTLSANTIGTYHLLQLAREKEVEKFLYFSSSEVYGAIEGIDCIPENKYGVIDPTAIRSCYSESKRMGETMCVSFAEQFQISASIVRPFHTYGPGLRFNDGRVFADFVSNIVSSKNIEMNSNGSAVRSFCYLSDATVGFFTILMRGETKQAYNVGNPKAAVSIKELAEMLVSLYPEKNIKAVFKEPDQSYISSSFSKLIPDIHKINALGWEPIVSVKEGFKRTIESFI